MDLELNDLLNKHGIDLSSVLLMRHRPTEPEVRKVLPWLANERPSIYNAYQSVQPPRVEKQLQKAEFVASIIGHRAGKGVFVGLYKVVGWEQLTAKSLAKIQSQQELIKLGVSFGEHERFLFNLKLVEQLSNWKGKLVLHWPPPERIWTRWANANCLKVDAMLEESMLVGELPNWRELTFSWEELQLIPRRWKETLSRWRGIYYIFDKSDGKGYVGSAYGEEGLLGRWMNYSKSGHGDNKLLKLRKPDSFHFSILKWSAPDMEDRDIVQRESSWKARLHTRAPLGLNEN